MRALGYLLFTLAVIMATVAGFVFFAAISDWRNRGCPGAEQCSDAVSVMVLTGCALVAAAVMAFAGMVFVRR
ncbi:hypothetical protein [Gymnodinialimonas hymeniacidonis]|uniref:hypothetical protein n=1 Tax=Gymnodinialimonas hymeniacidonis TaxID=3126508 RepID=UPI0034C671B1